MGPEMEPTPESSSIEEIGYDADAEEVWVRFGGSGLYAYSGVPEVVWDDPSQIAVEGRVREQRPEAKLPLPPGLEGDRASVAGWRLARLSNRAIYGMATRGAPRDSRSRR